MTATARRAQLLAIAALSLAAVGPANAADAPDQGTDGDRALVGPARPVSDHAGAVLTALIGPALPDYGDPAIDTHVVLEGGLRGGYLWRSGPFAVQLHATTLLAGAADQGGDGADGVYLSLLGGGEGRFYFREQVWMGIGLSLGATILLGAADNSGLFRQPGGATTGASGAVTSFALRPELTVGWNLGRRLALVLWLFALDYSPPTADYGDRVEQLLRYHVAAGLAYRL